MERRRLILKTGLEGTFRIASSGQECYCISLMSLIPPPRAHLLHAFDGYSRDFAAHCAERIEDGDRLARAEIEALSDLAGDLAAAANGWGAAVGRLDLARVASFDPRRAGTLILETVFDEVLSPDAWRVLAAALELAQS